MMAFDNVIEQLYKENSTQVTEYLSCLDSVFLSLTIAYSKKDKIETAYFLYIIKKYHIIHNKPFSIIVDMILRLLRDPNMYCRENAMQAIYSIGDCDCVMKALKMIDNNNMFHHSKLISDGLLEYAGNKERLSQEIWNCFEGFSVDMKVTLLNYFRFSSGEYCKPIFELMIDETQDDEIRFSCIRYFGKYYFEPAYRYLLIYADSNNGLRWEYSAIASRALALYPSEATIALLKSNLFHSNWYIRLNSSLSLERLGLSYIDLIDVIYGNDRYASEILEYCLKVRELEKKETILI